MACILVVDDDAAFRTTVCEILAAVGYTVLEAGDGRACLATVRRHSIDLIVLDLLMPEQEGLETIHILRREVPAVKIIAISGGGQTGRMDFLEAAQVFGAQRTMRKPLRMQDLLAMIRELLGEDTGAQGGATV
jgi:CheY-like chemotaxis protein